MAARGAYETTPVYSLMKSLRICTVYCECVQLCVLFITGEKIIVKLKKINRSRMSQLNYRSKVMNSGEQYGILKNPDFVHRF